MLSRRPAICLSALATLYLLVGCSTYRSRSVGVTVRDAETHEPIPNAVVQLSHHHLGSDAVTEKTGSDGIARVSFTPSSEESTMIEASESGHTSEFQVVGDSEIIAISPPSLFGSQSMQSSNFVLDLYAAPAFGVELVVPQGFHGLLKVQLNFSDQQPVPRGQRVFSFEAAADGQVKGNAPAILRRVPASSYTIRYTDGTPIGDKMDATTVGVRWLKNVAGSDMFIVGTEADYEQSRKDAGISSDSPPDSNNKKQGGRGGRGGGGRRGGGGGGGSN
jgi:uncharacterized membrane protein YgcG